LAILEEIVDGRDLRAVPKYIEEVLVYESEEKNQCLT
jgi:hypothetical protein